MAKILEYRNAASDDEAASFLDRYEELQGKIEALKIEHMNKCGAVHAEMAGLLDGAYAHGVAKGDIKDAAKARALRKKLHDLLTGRDDDSRVKSILEAIGDDFASFGLGAAAAGREEGEGDDDGPDPVAAAAGAAWEGAGAPAH